jgi:Putative Ig domain/Galactose oxidase, central domain
MRFIDNRTLASLGTFSLRMPIRASITTWLVKRIFRKIRGQGYAVMMPSWLALQSPHSSATIAMKKIPLPVISIVWTLRGILFLAGLTLVPSHAVASGGFEATGNLNTERFYHTATLLSDGRVLVAGGLDQSADFSLASAELYDPALGSWNTTLDLNTARFLHRATLLANGMVLVSGGLDGNFNPSGSAELYDPALGSWTDTGSFNTARYLHTATLLPSGMVLVAGGLDSNGVASASAELYDPALGSWTATGSLSTARYVHTATLLASGMVLVAGGLDSNGVASASAELYHPALGNWTTISSLNTARQLHKATLLANGVVLVAGGLDSSGAASASAELYDPALGKWTATGSLNTARYDFSSTRLANGMVLVTGGLDSSGVASASAELYDPALGSWNATGSLNTARAVHTATLLPKGMVLVAGGLDSTGTASASAELYASVPPSIISPLEATATGDLPFSYQFEATGATSIGVDEPALPDGLRFDSVLRAILGTPLVEGTFQVNLNASNGAGTTNATLVLTLQPLPASGPVIISVTSATGRTGSPFKFQVITSGGTAATRVTATGLPPGLSIDSVTGEISGTVTADGSFLVTLSATDAGITNTATLQLTFTSDLTIPVITSANSAFLFPGLDFLYTIDAPIPDSADPATYSRVGPLPPGLGLDPDAGIISGIPNLGLGLPPTPSLAGGVVTNTQLFACNASGCAAQGLFFLLPTGAANISTRLSVGTDADVLIGGFITEGNAPMKLVTRGIGPSLAQFGVSGVLPNPYLELHGGDGATIAGNDNWKENLEGGSQEVAIENTGLAPMNDLESAILGILDPGGYTAILKGTSNGTGVGLVEVYNLGAASMDVSSEAHLANISTRGNVQTGDNVMIGGFINEGATPIQVLIRGIGPSLTQFGVSGALANPTLELNGPDGVVTNDDWMTDQKADIMATGLAPSNALESAILITLPVGEGLYTATVRGANNTTGVGLVEAYFGNPCLGTSCP